MAQPSKTSSLMMDATEAFDWRTIYHMLRERLWLIILCVVAAGCLGFIYLQRAEVRYGAYAIVQVDQTEQRIMDIQSLEQNELGSGTTLNTLVQTMNNSSLMRRAVEARGFHKNPAFMPLPEGGENAVADAASFLAQNVSASIRKDTRLIDVTGLHQDPEMAREMVEAVVQQFVESGFRQRAQNAQSATEFLMKEAGSLQGKLTKSEQALYDFRKTNDAISLMERQDIASAQLANLNSQLSSAKNERVALASDVAKSRQLAGLPADLIQLPSVADSGPVVSLKSQISVKEGELIVIKQRYKAKHPNYIQAATELQNLREALDKAVLDAAGLLGEKFTQAQEIERNFQAALKAQEQKQLELNQLSIAYNILARQVEADRAMYEAVLARMRQTDLTQGISDSPIRVVEPAWSSSIPVEPQKTKIMLASILGGLVAGIGLALALSLLDSTLKTVDQAEAILNLPVLAAVPLSGKYSRLKNTALATIKEPCGTIAESVRSLRAALSLLGKESERKSFLFTSSMPSEGKSVCAVNCAIAFAQQGLSTLLIDADLRVPALGSIFLEDYKVPGLTEYLIGKAGLDAARDTEVGNLKLLSAGTQAPNPAELLGSEGFTRLIEEATANFDRVVIDAAPLIPVSDTLLLAPRVQSIVLVVRAGFTSRRAVLRACRSLKDIGCKPVGVVFNGVPQDAKGFYYSYNAGKSYGREGIYSAPAEPLERAGTR